MTGGRAHEDTWRGARGAAGRPSTRGASGLPAAAPRGPVARWGMVLLAVAAILACLGRPTAAQAHVELLGSSPAQGQRVSLDLDRVSLEFGEELLDVGNAIAVRGPDGRQVAVGAVATRGRVVGVRLALAGPGRHTLTYRVVGEDGHAITGGLSFTVAAGDPARAASGQKAGPKGSGLTGPRLEGSGRAGAEGASAPDRAQPAAGRPATAASPARGTDPGPAGSGTPWVLPVLAVGFLALLGYGGRRRRT